MNTMLEDLSTLPPKRLEKQLETLAHDALPCHAVTVFEGDPDAGLTVAVHVESRRRGDVLDLSRVVEDDARVHGVLRLVAAAPDADGAHSGVCFFASSFERPVQCDFTVGFDVREHPSDPLRATPPVASRRQPLRLRLRWTDRR